MTAQLALPVDVTDVGEVRCYRIVLPFLPPSKNKTQAWPMQWKSAAKKKWIRHIVAEVAALDMPKGNVKIGLAAVLVFPTMAHRDPQNYAEALWNWVPDALQVAGVLVNDTDKNIEFPPNLGIKFAYDKRKVAAIKRQKTVLSITMRV